MANLLPNLNNFLVEMQSYIEPIKQENGKLILALRQDVWVNPDKYLTFARFFNPLKKKLNLEGFIALNYVTKPCRLPNIDFDLPMVDRIEFHIDIIALHVNRLKAFFQQGITKEDVKESIGYLIENGWTEKEFQVEIGLSRSTFFRYLPKNGSLAPEEQSADCAVAKYNMFSDNRQLRQLPKAASCPGSSDVDGNAQKDHAKKSKLAEPQSFYCKTALSL